MNPLHLHKKIIVIFHQRNFLFVLAFALLIINILLCFILVFKKDMVIIVPANLNKEIAISSSGFSQSYIEEMTVFFVHLLLDMTNDNIQYNAALMMKHVAAPAFFLFHHYFEDNTKKYKEYNLVTYFTITEIKINGLNCVIKGILTSAFGQDSKKEEKISYDIGYKNHSGKLEVVNFRIHEDKVIK